MIHKLSALNGTLSQVPEAYLRGQGTLSLSLLFLFIPHGSTSFSAAYSRSSDPFPALQSSPPFTKHLLGWSFPFFPLKPRLAHGPYSQIGLHWGDKCTANALKRVVKKKKKNADSACQDYHPSWRGREGGCMGGVGKGEAPLEHKSRKLE